MKTKHPFISRPMLALATAMLVACGQSGNGTAADSAVAEERPMASISPVDTLPFQMEEVATLDHPWAMAFMPGTSLLFISGMKGAVVFYDLNAGRMGSIESGLPDVDFGGQGGLGDIAFSPDWPKGETSGGYLYLSWAEAGEGNKRGAVVGRGKLICEQADSCRLDGLKVIWRQEPKVTGRGHYSHRLAFSRDGKYLFISSGERQKKDPAQDLSDNLGTIVRLFPDGTVPEDNPFADRPSPTDQIWSLGHRNILGLAFDENGNLWESEMGPKGGDELNLIRRGENYGWPLLSNGVNYDGTPIDDHDPDGEENETETVAGGAKGYSSPKISWSPSISPANLMFYNGTLFPDWTNSLFTGGLSGQTLIRIAIDDQEAEIANRWPMDDRIREVEQGPEGEIWLLTDGREAPDGKGKLLKMTPAPSGNAE